MTVQKDLATHAGALCVGTVAFALGDPSGGTLLATPITALAALGFTLKVGCAAKAEEKARNAAARVLSRNPEYSEEACQRALDLLKEAPATSRLDPKPLAAAIHGQDFEAVVVTHLLGVLALGDDDTHVREIIEAALVAGLVAAKNDADFRAGLTLELLLETARKQNIGLAIAKKTAADVADIKAMLSELIERQEENGSTAGDYTLEELVEAAEAFGGGTGSTKAELLAFLTTKAAEYNSFRTQIDQIDERVAGLGNLKAAAQNAAERLDFEEVENLLSMVHATELEIAWETASLRADNALLRGRTQQAFDLISVAADAFAAVDPVEPASRRTLDHRLYKHALRYGGDGFLHTIAMKRTAVDHITEIEQPGLLGDAQDALANALSNQGVRYGGEEGEKLLAEAITAYYEALRVRTEADHPVRWAMTQNNLGIALRNQGNRAGGEAGAKLLAEAVSAYRAALRVHTETNSPVQWAETQNNLGAALRSLGSNIGGKEGAKLLAEAVAAYRAALRVYTEAHHPVDWAMTQNNLGAVLRNQGSRTVGEEGAKLLAEAVATYQAALRVRTKLDHPVPWAMTQGNLALANEAIAEHESCTDRRPHLEAALAYAENALRIYDPEHMPYDFEKATQLRDRIAAKLAALED